MSATKIRSGQTIAPVSAQRRQAIAFFAAPGVKIPQSIMVRANKMIE